MHLLNTARIDAKLYWFPISHPSHAVRTMLEMKGIDYDLVHVLPGNQRVHMRLAGFRGGTVPALKIGGRRIQGTMNIANELEALAPDPPLFPSDPATRRRVDEVARWGDDKFQPVPRRILRYGLTKDPSLRQWLAEEDGAMPAPSLTARLTGPVSYYYAWVVRASEDQARRHVAELPALLDRVDELVGEERIIGAHDINVATLEVMCTIRSLLGFSDFEELVGARSYTPLARELFPHYPAAQVPPFVDRLGLR